MKRTLPLTNSPIGRDFPRKLAVTEYRSFSGVDPQLVAGLLRKVLRLLCGILAFEAVVGIPLLASNPWGAALACLTVLVFLVDRKSVV